MVKMVLETLLILSVAGGGAIATLLVLRPITSRFISLKWQYYLWLPIFLLMLFPIWIYVPDFISVEHTT